MTIGAPSFASAIRQRGMGVSAMKLSVPSSTSSPNAGVASAMLAIGRTMPETSPAIATATKSLSGSPPGPLPDDPPNSATATVSATGNAASNPTISSRRTLAICLSVNAKIALIYRSTMYSNRLPATRPSSLPA